MPPKKRTRKTRSTTMASKITSPAKLEVSHKRPQQFLGEDTINFSVPPKKRKTGLSAIESVESAPETIGCGTKISVPEWLKVSIQLMLLNFHPEGVALLNSVESEFEDMYMKINPEVYGFEDWEEMLKSSQFKKHFFMYTDKKMMYVKGLPLPRSGTINLRNNVWEIDPKVEMEMPLVFQEPAFLFDTPSISRTSSTSTTANVEEDLGTGRTNSSEGNGKNSASFVLSPAPKTSGSTGRKSKIYGSEYVRLDSDFLSSTRVKPSVMSKSIPDMVDESEERDREDEDNETGEKSLKSDIPDEKESCTVVGPVSNDENVKNTVEKEDSEDVKMNVNSPSDGNPILVKELMSKRTDATDTWTGIDDDDDDDDDVVLLQTVPKSAGESRWEPGLEIEDSRWDDNFFRRSDVPEEWTKTRFADDDKSSSDKLSSWSHEDDDEDDLSDLVIDETDENELEQSDSTKLGMNDRELLNSPSPPPPTLHRMDILPPAVDHPKTTEDEKSEEQPTLPEIVRSVSVIRTISEEAKDDSDLTNISDNESSILNSPVDPSEFLDKDRKNKQSTGILDPGVLFFPWAFQAVHVSESDVPPETTEEKPKHPETKVDATRDPRLTIGSRAKLCSKVERVEETDESKKDELVEVKTEETEKTEESIKSPSPKKAAPENTNHDYNVNRSISGDSGRNHEADFGVVGDNLPFMQKRHFESFRRVIREAPGIPSQTGMFENHIQPYYQSEEAQTSFAIPPENLTVTIRCHPEEPRIKSLFDIPAVSFVSMGQVGHESSDRNASRPFDLPLRDRKSNSERAHSSKRSTPLPKSRHGGLKNPIPDDGVRPEFLTFEALWKAAAWKNRFYPDKDNSNKFFSKKVLDRWKETKRKELTPQIKQSLVSELQTYENKPFPSRCEYYCRAALRMVEVDYSTNSQFSEPRNSQGQKLVQPDEILFYVDFAGAPGGVAEFYSKKRPWGSKGFGITYKKKFYDFKAIPEIIPQYFEAFYGKLNSNSGDGSLFSAATVDLFVGRIRSLTKGRGVHIVTTIGNLSRVFEENNDKIWKYQHLAQIYVGLQVLREDGNMIFKMYDIKSPFTAALLYFLYKSFKQVEIMKLDIFAPASDEKAIVCLGRRTDEEVAGIITFLGECHKVMGEWYQKDRINSKNKETIGELIPLKMLEERKPFMDYLRASNDKLKNRQTEDLILLTKNLKAHKSIFTRAMYRRHVASTIERWNVGLRPLYVPSAIKTPAVAYRELKVFPEDICEGVETLLNEYNLYSIFSRADPWRFVPIGKLVKTRGFYLGVDNSPYFFDQKYKEWVPVKDFSFSLPSQTLVYAQIVSVHDHVPFLESTETVFAVIDALYLAGKDVRNLPYKQRMLESSYFCSAVTKVFFPNWLRLTITEARCLTELPSFLLSIKDNCTFATEGPSTMVEKSRQLSLQAASVFPQFVSPSKCFHPSGVLFFETNNGNSSLDFCATLFSRVIWKWVDDMDLPLILQEGQSSLDVSALSSVSGQAIGSVSAKKLVEFVNRYS